jgi:hypothetical protein
VFEFTVIVGGIGTPGMESGMIETIFEKVILYPKAFLDLILNL